MKYANSTGYRQMALGRAFAESRKTRKPTFRYQRLKKNGEWGKVLDGELGFYKTPEMAISEWNRLNPDTRYRLVEN